jgi:hypothetical protein
MIARTRVPPLSLDGIKICWQQLLNQTNDCNSAEVSPHLYGSLILFTFRLKRVMLMCFANTSITISLSCLLFPISTLTNHLYMYIAQVILSYCVQKDNTNTEYNNNTMDAFDE